MEKSDIYDCLDHIFHCAGARLLWGGQGEPNQHGAVLYFAKASAKAAYEKAVEIAKGFLEDGISVDIVAKNTKLPREEVEAIAKRLGKLIA